MDSVSAIIDDYTRLKHFLDTLKQNKNLLVLFDNA